MRRKLISFLLLGLTLAGCATVDYSKGREEYISTHPKISEQTKSDIREGVVRIGMTKEEARACWGVLTDQYDWVVKQSKTCNSSGCYEVWERAGTYYTFLNDKLESFTEISPY